MIDRPAPGEPLTAEQAFAARVSRDRDEIDRLWQGLSQSGNGRVDRVRLQRLEDLAHGLYGAGGTFGFDKISLLAGELELTLETCRLNNYDSWPSCAAMVAAQLPALRAALAAVNSGGD